MCLCAHVQWWDGLQWLCTCTVMGWVTVIVHMYSDGLGYSDCDGLGYRTERPLKLSRSLVPGRSLLHQCYWYMLWGWVINTPGKANFVPHKLIQSNRSVQLSGKCIQRFWLHHHDWLKLETRNNCSEIPMIALPPLPLHSRTTLA